LHAADIRGWQAGSALHGASGDPAVADVLFLAERVVLEVDGERAHSGRAAFVRDRRRQNDLVTAGYLVLRFTWWDLTRRPETVIAQIRAALAIRRP
jgi:very-short-patch-repair endonuclease